MPRLSLRTKIMICCISLVALLDLAVVVLVRSRLSRTLRSECLVKGRNLAVNLAARSEHFVLTEDFVSLLQLVTDLKHSDEDVAYVYVVNRNRRVLAHTFSGGFPTDLVGLNIPHPADSETHVALATDEAGLVHDIAVPILRGKVGFAYVGISERRIQQTISHLTTAIVVIAGVVLLIAGGLAALVSWVVTQPVRSLTRAAQKIRDGELGEQVVATTGDEIGDLVDSFNQMSGELLKQHKVLDDRNVRLRIAQEQVAGERDKLRAIIDSMVEGVVFVDTDDRISLCNESAEQIWGVSAKESLGKPVHECPSAELRSKLEEILEQVKENSILAASHSQEVRNRQCLTSYSTVHGGRGRYLGLVLLSLDVSEQVALESEHKRLRDQLFQQEKMVLIGQIAASVAHELNTPLGTILLRSQLVRHQMDERSDLSDLKVVEAEAQRCRRIIDSLLSFSRRSEGVMSTTDVDSLIKESLSLVEHDLALKGISLKKDCGANGTSVRVDTNQIQQVLLNVITNAADAVAEGGRLKVATRFMDDQNIVEIRVTDNGCGMEQDVLNRAFDPFFTTKEPGKGTGLGLAICQRIIEEHQGQITIQSQPGEGTTVSIHLPAGTGIDTDE